MRKTTWVRIALYVTASVLGLAATGLVYLAASEFTYYDNGAWVHSNLLAVYAQSLGGYGRKPIEERLLGPDWGAHTGYAARNFTLDLVGLDYSLPLSWQDIVSGPGLWVMRPPFVGPMGGGRPVSLGHHSPSRGESQRESPSGRG